MAITLCIGQQMPKVEKKFPQHSSVEYVNADEDGVVVIVDLTYALSFTSGISFSNNTVMSYIDPTTGIKVEVPITALRGVKGVNAPESAELFQPLPLETKITSTFILTKDLCAKFALFFDKGLPKGVTSIDVYERGVSRGFKWMGIHVTPIKRQNIVPYFGRGEMIDSLMSVCTNEYCGNYEEIEDESNGYKLSFVTKKDSTFLVYRGSSMNSSPWKEGDIKAILKQTSAESVYKGIWFMANKSTKENVIVKFEEGLMYVKISGIDEIDHYIKMGKPNSKSGKSSVSMNTAQWTGTGFALSDGYIVTNYHVAENAKEINIWGVNGDFSKSYKAILAGADKVNDIALLKISDSSFLGFNKIPYAVKTTMADVGETIFVLGYPLTTTMGEEIKLTNGIISSKSGFDGDVALYQMTAPIQPGNSGGPMFDSEGNIVGIVCAHHKGAENASYAIKTSYLKNLVESVADNNILPSINSIKGMELKNQVKNVNNFVFLIKCND